MSFKISGTNSVYVYHYDGKKLLFFGDQHFDDHHDCKENLTIIDYMDQLIINNHYDNIQTDYYIEFDYLIGDNIKIDKSYDSKGSLYDIVNHYKKYLPNNKINKHNFIYPVDIRVVNDGKRVVEVDPFLYFSFDVNKNLIKNIIDNDDIIINGLFFNEYTKMIQFLKSIYTDDLLIKIEYLNKLTVVKNGKRIHILSDLLSKLLKLNIKIYNQVIQFMYYKLGQYINYKNKLLALSSLSMDIYVLTKLLLSDSQCIVTYTGYEHTMVYYEFFNYINITPIYHYPYQHDRRCIVVNNKVW